MFKNKLIIIPIEGPWDHSADFLRQTALTLSKNNLVYIYDHNNHYFFLKKNKKRIYPKYKNIIFYQVKYWFPLERFSFINRINRYLSFKIFMRTISKKKKILWIFYPNYYDLAKIKSKNIIKIYDCVDYSENREKEKILINNVDYFFVNSLILYKLHNRNKIEPTYIDSQGFFESDLKKIKVVKLKQIKPVIGYVGGFNYRLDFILLDKLIKNNKNWQFVFFGPIQKNLEKDIVFNTSFWLKKFIKYENVFFGQSNNKNQVYGVIKNFDVCIIPYNVDIYFNKYCYPSKFFEFLYLGKPIISSPILELKQRKFNRYVKIVENYVEWKNMINNCLKNKLSENQINIQKKLAIYNSWENKIKKIEKYIYQFD